MQKKVIRAKRKEDAIKLAQNTLGNDIVILDSKLVQSEKNPNEKLYVVTVCQNAYWNAIENLQRTILRYEI